MLQLGIQKWTSRSMDNLLHWATEGHSPCVAVQFCLDIRLQGGALLLVPQDISPLTQFQFRVVFRMAIAAAGWQHEHISPRIL